MYAAHFELSLIYLLTRDTNTRERLRKERNHKVWNNQKLSNVKTMYGKRKPISAFRQHAINHI